MTHRRLATFMLAPLVVVAAPLAAGWLSGSELERHCRALLSEVQSRDGLPCVAFIQGFMAGAEVAEDAVGIRPSFQSAYAERAARTRIGSRLKAMGWVDADYCIDASVPSEQVIEKVAAHITERANGSAREAETQAENAGLLAERLVYDALVEQFPCDDS